MPTSSTTTTCARAAFTVSGIYQTNMTRFDEQLCFTDLYTVNKLNGWFEDQCSGAELLVDDFDRLDDDGDGRGEQGEPQPRRV